MLASSIDERGGIVIIPLNQNFQCLFVHDQMCPRYKTASGSNSVNSYHHIVGWLVEEVLRSNNVPYLRRGSVLAFVSKPLAY